MSKNMLTPRYLTQAVAEEATDVVLGAVMFGDSQMRDRFSRIMCHVVVLVPSVEDVREAGYPDWPDYPIKPAVIYERSVEDAEPWPYPFDEIARCKAQQLWRGQNTDGNTDSMPHLLFPDDTPYWGGVKRHGFVVACSGVQPYFDQMISGMIADMIKALARHEWEISDDKSEGHSFIK